MTPVLVYRHNNRFLAWDASGTLLPFSTNRMEEMLAALEANGYAITPPNGLTAKQIREKLARKLNDTTIPLH